MRRMLEGAGEPIGSERVFKSFGAFSFNAGRVTGASAPPPGAAEPQSTLPDPPRGEIPAGGGPLGYIKRVVVMVVGGTVLAIGVALIVLPGPAFIVIPLGLAILAIEFAWARRWLRSARAILSLNSKNDSSTTKKRVQSVRRSIAFLLRQVRRSVCLPQENNNKKMKG
jgi:uncharacterized protein (TIGR02611 family)